MPINIDYYVNVTSATGAAETVANRQLIPLIFDDNALIPSGSYVNFPNNSDGAANVSAYFGSTSEEYERALFAFGFTSKGNTGVPSISFARFNSAACAPVIFGDPTTTTTTIATWTAITAGSFTLTMGVNTFTLSGLNFSTVTTLAQVAGVIQTAIEAETGGGTLWTSATVTYNATRGSFDLLGGATGAAPISVTAGASNDVSALLGWLSASTILGPGADIQTPQAALTDIAAVNNNFGSFAFMSNLSLTTQNITDVANANKAVNRTFMYCVPVTTSNATTIQTAIGAIGGSTAVLLNPNVSGQYEEMMPMIILGATNYNIANSTVNFMFNQFPGVVPYVTTDALAATYDALLVNYYASTQEAGQIINLYQRGVMNGGSNDALAQNTYANEMWMKSAMTSSLMTLLLDLNKISANAQGQAQVLSICQSVIDEALANGTISVGETLTAAQKLFITNATNDPNAWRHVQNIGYVISTSVTSSVVNNRTQYQINYTLVYAQDNVVNKIEGSDILI